MSDTIRLLRRRSVWLLLAIIGAILAACGSPDGPEAAAQRYVDAIIREDYAAAVAEVDTSRMGRPAVLAVLPFLRAGLVRQHGALTSATIKRLPTSSADRATVLVTWHSEQGDVASSVALTHVDDVWKVVDMPDGAVRQESDYIELPPVQPPATPETYWLTVQVPELSKLSNRVAQQASVEVVELERSEQLSQLDGELKLRDLAPGSYTLRLTVPGRAVSNSTVQIGAGQPGAVVLRLGERQPIDPNTTLLLANPRGDGATFATLGEGGFTRWGGLDFWRVRGWDASYTSLHFVDDDGIGEVGIDGSVEYSWRVPERLSNSLDRTWAYRPDLAEIVYVENKDVFSLAPRPGATPKRWTRLGIFRSLSGYVDDDTVLVNTDTHRNVLRRDGSTYRYREHELFGGLASSVDRLGAIRFVQEEGALLQPGATKLENRIEIAPVFDGIFDYGWTTDNNFFLAHSAAAEPGAGSGIVAIGQDGTGRWIAPELVAGSDYAIALERRAKSWAFEPHGSRMALAWHAEEGGAGIYVVDAQHGAARVSSVPADTVFWPAESSLIYVVETGPQMGTWQLSPNGGQPRKLFAYRAVQAGATPGGELLLIANRTLWRVAGGRDAEIVGEEGAMEQEVQFMWPMLFNSASR